MSWREFEEHAKSFFEQEFATPLLAQIPIRLRTGENHKFDLISKDEQVVIECKSHTWTKSGNYPSAKVTDAQRSIELLHKCNVPRRIIAFQDHKGPRETLVEVFVRRNKELLSGIEVWRHLDGKFELYTAFAPSSTDGSITRVKLVASFILDAIGSSSHKWKRFQVTWVAEQLGIEIRQLKDLAPEICLRIRDAGMVAHFDGSEFDVKPGGPTLDHWR